MLSSEHEAHHGSEAEREFKATDACVLDLTQKLLGDFPDSRGRLVCRRAKQGAACFLRSAPQLATSKKRRQWNIEK
ncbi:hypothetical protein Q2941_47445 [Bradyrhizobium sp. UFLA05-153]